MRIWKIAFFLTKTLVFALNLFNPEQTMFHKMKEYIAQAVKFETLTPEEFENECIAKKRGALFLMVVSIMLTLLNIINHYWFMTSTTLVLVFGFAIAAILAWRLKQPAYSAAVMGLMVAFIFSIYAITGENEGFAILWILLTPALSMGLLGIRTGFWLSLYFQVFLIVLFYTPLREVVIHSYSRTFIIRFPLLYFCSLGATTIITIQRDYYVALVKKKATIDSLTGLKNRSACMDYLSAHGKAADLNIAFVDLNGLKDVNDIQGHSAGDEYLKGVADCLLKAFPEPSFTARLGGDEFAVISTDEPSVFNAQLSDFRKSVNEWHGRLVDTMSVSVGAALRKDYPEAEAEQLFRIADSKMYLEKSEYYKTAPDALGVHRRKSDDRAKKAYYDASINHDIDSLTGLLTQKAFQEKASVMLAERPGGYFIIYLNYLHFKAINSDFGVEKGDELLRSSAEEIKELTNDLDLSCRLNSDKFAVLISSLNDVHGFISNYQHFISQYNLPYEIICGMGVYRVEPDIPISRALDFAILAHSSIKGNYVDKVAWYSEEMKEKLLLEQQIAGMTSSALAEHQFVPYFQPQYNHSTGLCVGAEVLARWEHPTKGFISPDLFIPIIEKAGYITELDIYMFEEACRFVRKCLSNSQPVVPISANFSRYDICRPDLVDTLNSIREKYNVPPKYLRVEITESAVIGGSKKVAQVVKELHDSGYIVEMDDFGTGYSSLNVLKDIDFDIIKLDMRFLATDSGNHRGGTILSSVVRMSQWLDIPIIAEGVETAAQADYLESIGCDHVQGYFYSKPLCEKDFEQLLNRYELGTPDSEINLLHGMQGVSFWDPDSQETLIFSSLSGPAAILEYENGSFRVDRVNKQYLKELGMNQSQMDVVSQDLFETMDSTQRAIYENTLRLAIETGNSEECETWRTISSDCCGKDRMCILSTVRVIGTIRERYLFYVMVRNITREKKMVLSLQGAEKNFNTVTEQVGIYFWEYNIATKEMHPCFRCMRDLGLPPLLRNYPEPAFERGIFPPETADLYRDWHRQLEKGTPYLEGVFRLTEDRIPFFVRYTTEFDESGRPVKAYGSAAKIVIPDEH